MRRVFDIVKRKIGDETQHDTKRSPHLPHHDEGTANRGRRALGGIDGDGGRLGADTETKDESGGLSRSEWRDRSKGVQDLRRGGAMSW
jgi:hypothetical protein